MQHTVIHRLKMSWAPSNSWNVYTKHIVALDLFCCCCRRCSYFSSIGLLQLCWVILRSVNKADHCRGLLQWLGVNQTGGGSRQWNSGCWHQTRNKRNVFQLESRNNRHSPVKSSTQLRCHLVFFCGQRKGTMCKCARCDVGLCMVPCLAEYHTKINL